MILNHPKHKKKYLHEKVNGTDNTWKVHMEKRSFA